MIWFEREDAIGMRNEFDTNMINLVDDGQQHQ